MKEFSEIPSNVILAALGESSMYTKEVVRVLPEYTHDEVERALKRLKAAGHVLDQGGMGRWSASPGWCRLSEEETDILQQHFAAAARAFLAVEKLVQTRGNRADKLTARRLIESLGTATEYFLPRGLPMSAVNK